MNPTNNPTQQSNSAPLSVIPESPAPEKVGNPVPKTEKKFLVYGVVIGLVVVVIVGVAGFYMKFAPKEKSETASVPATVAVEESTSDNEVSQVEDASELDNIIVGLAQADGELDEEITALEKDSDF